MSADREDPLNECLILAAEVRSPKRAREWVSTRCGTNPDTIFVAELLVSELVSNAVVHAKSSMVLSLERGAARLHVEVEDHGGGQPHFFRRGGGRLDRISGRGLQIVSNLASSWGVRTTTEGKAVWFDLPLG
jgi:anti-sigma regulatory factor (Ser/Thr protein kinase)